MDRLIKIRNWPQTKIRLHQHQGKRETLPISMSSMGPNKPSSELISQQGGKASWSIQDLSSWQDSNTHLRSKYEPRHLWKEGVIQSACKSYFFLGNNKDHTVTLSQSHRQTETCCHHGDNDTWLTSPAMLDYCAPHLQEENMFFFRNNRIIKRLVQWEHSLWNLPIDELP